MKLEKKEALYKIKGTKHPKKLYEVWKDTEGVFLVDIWFLTDKNRDLYELDDTFYLENFIIKANKFEEIKVKRKIIRNIYLQLQIPKKEKELKLLKRLVLKYKKEVMEILYGNKRAED